MTPITEKTVFHTPSLVRYEAAGLPLFLDPESPNWAAVEPRGSELLARADGATPTGRIVADYAAAHGLEAGKAWLHVHDFFREARRAGIVSEAPFRRPPYAGRLAYGEPRGLSEFWVHSNNSCNLTCRQCLVSSGPDGLPGLSTGVLKSAIREAHRRGDLGFDVALTTVVTERNLGELPELAALARSLGARSQHLMWSHRRGRAIADHDGLFPEAARIVPYVIETSDAARREGIVLDNLEAVRRRVDGRPGLKYDLGNAGWDSVCLYADGTIYPSAALAGEEALACGRFPQKALEKVLRESPVLRAFREATVARRESVAEDPIRFLTGGGDIEHAYLFASSGNRPGPRLEQRLAAPDPYYSIQTAVVQRVWDELVAEAAARVNRQSGYDAPRVVRAMGETSIACGVADGALAEREVLTTHSNCVLSFDVDKPRALVRTFYSRAAATPQAGLCCPTTFDEADIEHIPKDVIDRFYGCGSPVAAADVTPGEVFVDLGCGAGIDVFIAAKKVGRDGRAVGIDMTGRMLEIARANDPIVAARLGYGVSEFREGFLESPPVPSRSIDIVTSNCVINLSP